MTPLSLSVSVSQNNRWHMINQTCFAYICISLKMLSPPVFAIRELFFLIYFSLCRFMQRGAITTPTSTQLLTDLRGHVTPLGKLFGRKICKGRHFRCFRSRDFEIFRIEITCLYFVSYVFWVNENKRREKCVLVQHSKDKGLFSGHYNWLRQAEPGCSDSVSDTTEAATVTD